MGGRLCSRSFLLWFRGMRTIQQSEGMHSLIKLKVSAKMRLWEFVRAIDLSLSWLRHCESKDDFDTLGRTNMIEIEK
ncbi:hypothetical protein TorRG33x02_291790 [Trema orientale]|uniref:Uncharacterized protein n=1 Tax=Trema orientale TaxID=63057 RepID=A0A2P5CAT4_TREOI|nr:hypothetical protein TorRG33x02_291790 [Trema orientale]